MPSYGFSCASCGEVEVTHAMREPHPTACPQCSCADFTRIYELTAVRPPADMNWQLENNGRGRFIPQLGSKGDPKAYCRDLNTVGERARARGQTFERD